MPVGGDGQPCALLSYCKRLWKESPALTSGISKPFLFHCSGRSENPSVQAASFSGCSSSASAPKHGFQECAAGLIMSVPWVRPPGGSFLLTYPAKWDKSSISYCSAGLSGQRICSFDPRYQMGVETDGWNKLFPLMTGHELAEQVLATLFLSYVKMRVRMQVDSCFRVRSLELKDSSSPAPRVGPLLPGRLPGHAVHCSLRSSVRTFVSDT